MKVIITSFLISSLLVCKNINAQQNPLGLGLQLFKNIEQIEYCVPLPLKEFKELPASQRAQHSFINKKNKKVTITVKGFFRADTTITIDNYFDSSYTERDEEEGKIVTQKEVLKNKKCFYAIGYYNNFISKYEFLEVTWVRKDEVTKLEVIYAIKDKKLWYDRLKIIIKNAYCR
jgi:hypothetical protein